MFPSGLNQKSNQGRLQGQAKSGLFGVNLFVSRFIWKSMLNDSKFHWTCFLKPKPRVPFKTQQINSNPLSETGLCCARLTITHAQYRLLLSPTYSFAPSRLHVIGRHKYVPPLSRFHSRTLFPLVQRVPPQRITNKLEWSLSGWMRVGSTY